ncbi:SDR family oxidoreductase [Novosphingobium sp. LASN5T]|uniref:SDR family oxidoreductase n=1 Tax=Novosphingobium sp. LASN5T TaxID=2491021 RepID=UPI000F603D36|nr:SDR family oxidoreductase [Novosphingobium sp. LASN5T]RQW42828.1 SDR family oxidoreductase [Novosphingobium sp. LASN5T]
MKLVVTGANGSLGLAVIALLERQGHEIARIVRGTSADEPLTIVCEDLADATAAERSIGKAVEALGSLDGVVHLAGAFEWQPVVASDAALWRKLYRANLETTLNVVNATLPHLKAGGAMVTLGAAAAEPSGAGMAPYAASKSAVARLTQSLSAELAGSGIRINTLLPSIIDTPANRAAMPEADRSSWTHPDAIAEVVSFLVSPAARAIHGALIPVTNRVAH